MQRTPLNLAARRQALLNIKPKRWPMVVGYLCFAAFYVLNAYSTSLADFLTADAKIVSASGPISMFEDLNFQVFVLITLTSLAFCSIGVTFIMSSALDATAKHVPKLLKEGQLTVATPQATPGIILAGVRLAAKTLLFVCKVLCPPMFLAEWICNKRARSFGFSSANLLGYPANLEVKGKKRKVFVITDKSREEWAAGRVVEVYTTPGSRFAISGEFRDRLKEAKQ